jgi:hypothetical protein
MITLEGCVALCGLIEEEVLAIAEHEHLPPGGRVRFLSCASRHGLEKVRDMIVDDIRAVQANGNRDQVVVLLHVLHHFLRMHPDARPEQHRWSRYF